MVNGKRYKRKMPVRRTRKSTTVNEKSIKRVVSKMIMKKAEPKHKNIDHGKTELYHNSIGTLHLNKDAAMPSQGTADNQRVGDRINAGGFMIRMLCGQKNDRPNCTWKFWVIKTPKGSALGYANLFENITSNTMIDPINKDNCTILKQITIKKSLNLLGHSSWDEARECTFPIKMWIPYRKLTKFLTAASTNHSDGDIHLLYVCYDAFGTLQTDNIAYVDVSSTIYYKDP